MKHLVFKTPGVFVQEVRAPLRTIPLLPTSVTGFVGRAAQGPVNQPVLVRSLALFQQHFGDAVAGMELGPAVRLFFLNGGKEAWVVRVAARAAAADFGRALRALDTVNVLNLLALPGVGAVATLATAIRYCEQRRAFLLVDAPRLAKTPAQMLQAVQAPAWPRSDHAAVYYPWVTVPDSAARDGRRVTAPSGAIAAVLARIDASRGVWKSPAGTEAAISGVEAPAYPVSEHENGLLNPRAVNCLRVFPGRGLVVWGARTLAGDDAAGSEWKYIPVRRLALCIQESVERGLKWAASQPNREPLWVQVQSSVENFLLGLFRQGAFAGAKVEHAFFVKCDRVTMTPGDIAAGRCRLMIGIAPVKPAEFVMLRLQAQVKPG